MVRTVQSLVQAPSGVVAPEEPIETVRDLLVHGDCVAVIEGQRFCGLVEPRDLLRTSGSTAAQHIRERPPIAIDCSLAEALEQMSSCGTNVIPVLEGESLRGIVTCAAVARALAHGRPPEALSELDAEVHSKAERYDQTKKLASSFVHDLNNLLAIVSFIAPKRDPSTVSELGSAQLDGMREYIEDCRTLAREFLFFARDGGIIRPDSTASSVVRETATFVTRGHPRPVHFEVADELPSPAIGLEALAQITSILTSNALAACNGQGADPSIRISASAVARGGDDAAALELVVADDGPGIGEDVLPRIFDARFTTDPRNAGLGLTVAKSIVDTAGGTITVASNPPQGAEFRVVLPIATTEIGDRS